MEKIIQEKWMAGTHTDEEPEVYLRLPPIPNTSDP
jgi:hypothetical protein